MCTCTCTRVPMESAALQASCTQSNRSTLRGKSSLLGGVHLIIAPLAGTSCVAAFSITLSRMWGKGDNHLTLFSLLLFRATLPHSPNPHYFALLFFLIFLVMQNVLLYAVVSPSHRVRPRHFGAQLERGHYFKLKVGQNKMAKLKLDMFRSYV